MLSKDTLNLDYRRLVRKSQNLPSTGGAGTVDHSLRLAILSDAASQQFVPLFKTLFHENGIQVEIYEGAFDAIELEAYNPASSLYLFKPDAVVIANSTQALRTRYYSHRDGNCAELAAARIVQVWDALEAHSNARIIQFNFPLPCDTQFGNYDLKVPHSLYATVCELNNLVVHYARDRNNVLLCNVEAIASFAGRAGWFDERLWTMSKAFCNLELLPRVAQAVIEIVLATHGRVVKCIILDLDNTCWGGVVGDDGPLGIAIGAHGDGEPFYYFQQYLLALKKRGILLAVCSKNNHETAAQPFRENPGMVLKLDDIAAFVANWQDKAGNIRQISETLQLGLDSMVFLDDNPFERNLVRELIPDVIVPELPEDPAGYVQAISELNLFETIAFSAEDVSRAARYQQESSRREMQSAFTNLDDFLKSLDMRIEVGRFDKPRLARVAQLMQRSNQFNLTTRRLSEAECEHLMLNYTDFTPLTASLNDRFGDHGLISIVILRHNPEQKTLEITDWLMSCRVLVRGVEQYLMNHVVAYAQANGFHSLTARYLPSAKNAMVKDFFAQFGFTRVSDENGCTSWFLDVSAYQPSIVFIHELVKAV